MGFARDIGWVFLWLTVAGIGAYAMNSLGFRDYIDTYLEVFAKYESYGAKQAYQYEDEYNTDNINISNVG